MLGHVVLQGDHCGRRSNILEEQAVFSVPGNFLFSHLPIMDHRIGIFMLKLACVENFMLFLGLSDSE